MTFQREFVWLEADDLAEDAIRYQRRRTFDKRFANYKAMAEAGVASITTIASDSRFFEWLQFAADDRRQGYLDLRTKSLEGLTHYDIPAVRLPRTVEMGALVKIFETINRTGVRLATFDLMVARVYSRNFHLADEWEAARNDYPASLVAYDVDGVEILKTIALLELLEHRRGGLPSGVKGVRESDVLAVPATTVRDGWKRAVTSYVRAIEFLRDSVGVIRPQLVPSTAMILPITATLALRQSDSTADLKSWFWRAVVEQSYAQGANTQAVTDARRLVLGEETPALAFSRPPDLGFEALFQSRRRNETLLRGLLSLLVSDGCRDWFTNETLTDLSEPLVVTPIFPRRHVLDWGGDPDAILNLTLLPASSASRLNGRLPSEVLPNVPVHPDAWGLMPAISGSSFRITGRALCMIATGG